MRAALEILFDRAKDWTFLHAFGVGPDPGWGVAVIDRSESFFYWSTFDAILEWLDSSPPAYSFRAFHDVAGTFEGPEKICMVILGIIPFSLFNREVT